MRTIRQNVFETNSSSTHSATLCVRSGVKPSFKPYSPDGVIEVSLSAPDGDSEDWFDKMGMLGTYLSLTDRKNELPRIEKIISDFSGMGVHFNAREVAAIKPIKLGEDWTEGKKIEVIQESVKNKFYYFGKSDYGDGIGDFIHSIETILKDDDTILAFVCSGGWFDTEHYYD